MQLVGKVCANWLGRGGGADGSSSVLLTPCAMKALGIQKQEIFLYYNFAQTSGWPYVRLYCTKYSPVSLIGLKTAVLVA